MRMFLYTIQCNVQIACRPSYEKRAYLTYIHYNVRWPSCYITDDIIFMIPEYASHNEPYVLYTIQYTPYNIQHPVYIILHALCTIRYILYTIKYKVYCILYNEYKILHVLVIHIAKKILLQYLLQ